VTAPQRAWRAQCEAAGADMEGEGNTCCLEGVSCVAGPPPPRRSERYAQVVDGGGAPLFDASEVVDVGCASRLDWRGEVPGGGDVEIVALWVLEKLNHGGVPPVCTA
jgi:hypothetical protein